MFILISTVKFYFSNYATILIKSEFTMAESKDIKEMAEKASDLAKNIWLAGLGAYGKAIDEAQEQYDKVSGKVTEKVETAKNSTSEESTKLFDELVAKGKKLEGETSEKFDEVKEKTASNLEERLAQVKSSLSFASRGDNNVEAQLDDLSKKLDLIIDALGAKAAPKKTVKKAASKSEAK